MADKEYGIDYVSKGLGVSPATTRNRLRGEGVKRGDQKAYGWTKTAADAMIKRLSKEKKPRKMAAKKKATSAEEVRAAEGTAAGWPGLTRWVRHPLQGGIFRGMHIASKPWKRKEKLIDLDRAWTPVKAYSRR